MILKQAVSNSKLFLQPLLRWGVSIGIERTGAELLC